MALAADVVVVWAQPLQAHLVEGGPGDGQQLLDVGGPQRIAEQGDQETAVRGLPVEEVRKLRVEIGLPPLKLTWAWTWWARLNS